MAVKVVDLPAETAPTEDDFLLVRDNATGTTRKMAISVFLSTFIYKFVPPGAVLPYGTTSVPAGYLLCDGQAIDRTDYADLFSVIGTSYGPGNGVDTFNVPDLRGRVIVGKAASGTFQSINSSGGEERVTLSVAEMPAHWHDYLTPLRVFDTDRGGGSSVWSLDNNAAYSTTVTGGSQSHNNLQPYRVLNYIIKY